MRVTEDSLAVTPSLYSANNTRMMSPNRAIRRFARIAADVTLDGASHNVAVARVVRANGDVEFPYAVSSELGHAEGRLVGKLGLADGDQVTHLYTERAPCPDVCGPFISSHPALQNTRVGWSVPYYSRTTFIGRVQNEYWTDQLSMMITHAELRLGF